MGFLHPPTVLCLSLVPLATGGCAVEVADWPRPPARPPDARSASDAGEVDGFAPAPAETDAAMTCLDLAGPWSGSLSGVVSTGLGKVPVTGTVWVVLRPAGAGDFVIDKGEMTCQAKSLPTMKASQPLTGEVHCGVLDLTPKTDLLGVKAKGTVRCSFDLNGCEGTWTGEAQDGSGTTGSGTFELRRN